MMLLLKNLNENIMAIYVRNIDNKEGGRKS